MRDAVDDLIAKEVARDPEAATFVAAFESNERLLDALEGAREHAGLSQRGLAKRMGTSASVVAHLEAGHVDPRMSTIARYAASLGKMVTWALVDVAQPPSPGQREPAEDDAILGIIGLGNSGQSNISVDHDRILADLEIRRWRQ